MGRGPSPIFSNGVHTEGGETYAILLLVDFSNSHWFSYLRCTKFKCCTSDYKIPYMEI